MEPGIYTVRGPNGGTVMLQVPSPGLSLAAFESKLDSGEWTRVEDKPKRAPRKKAAKSG